MFTYAYICLGGFSAPPPLPPRFLSMLYRCIYAPSRTLWLANDITPLTFFQLCQLCMVNVSKHISIHVQRDVMHMPYMQIKCGHLNVN